MSEVKNKRNSSLELLRLICMLFIMFHHYSVHGNFIFTSNSPMFNQVFINVISFGGKLACLIFILISGYFMIDSKFNIKRLLKLIIKMFFYSLIFSIVLFGFNIIPFKMSTLIKELLPIFYGGWFVIYYILLCLISPILNKMLLQLNKNDYKKLVLILILIWSIIPTFTYKTWEFSHLSTFIIMYIVGGYIKLFDIKWTNKNNLAIGLNSMFIIIFSIIVATIVGKYFDISFISNNATYLTKENSIFVVISAIFIFNYFKNINYNSKEINYLASSCLGIYLIHDDVLVRDVLWNKVFPNNVMADSSMLFFHAIVKVLTIFVVCIIIDKIVDKILNITLYKLINDKKIEKLMDNINLKINAACI